MSDSRVGVVTGGARGIGLAIVRALLEQDVVDEVAVFDRDPTDVSVGKVHACDVTDVSSVQAAFDAVGVVPTVVVNNAGGGTGLSPGQAPTDPFGDVESFRSMVDLNLTSAHVVTSVIGPRLADGAVICNTASVAGIVPNSLFAYAAAKAGLIHWTRCMAVALAPRKIRVNAVAPGFIYTRLWEEMIAGQKQFFDELVKNQVPLSKDQTPEEIADAVAFLCSDRARMITGQVLPVDGGYTVGR